MHREGKERGEGEAAASRRTASPQLLIRCAAHWVTVVDKTPSPSLQSGMEMDSKKQLHRII